MSPMIRRIVGPVLVIAIFALAVMTLAKLLRGVDPGDVWAAFTHLPPARLGAALACMTVVYAIQSAYDLLAFHYLRYRLPLRKIMFTSLVGNTFGITLGFAVLTGGSLRYRLYSRWGFDLANVAKITAFGFTTFTLSLLLTSGLALILNAALLSASLPLPPLSLALVGAGLLLPVILYVGGSMLFPGRTVGRGRWQVRIPPARVAFGQILLSAVEVTLTGSVLFALLPASGLPWLTFLGFYVIAQISGFASQVPSGLGVFDAAMILFLRDSYPAGTILGALLLFRLLFYALPLLVALTLLSGYEMRKYAKA